MAEARPDHARRRRFARQDWLDIGFRLLKEVGPEAITLERLTAAARRTRGSFYHHFPDREAFVRALMEDWRARAGEQGTRRIREASSASELRSAVLDWPFALDHDLERAMRRFAAIDPVAREAVKTVDNDRVAGLTALIAQLRPGVADPGALALLQYAILVGGEWLLDEDDPRLPALRRAGNALFWPED